MFWFLVMYVTLKLTVLQLKNSWFGVHSCINQNFMSPQGLTGSGMMINIQKILASKCQHLMRVVQHEIT